ncbi:MAG TPA: chemotaxis protein CheW [Nitrospira sp.]|nr:chemotaxis protein CheW [Nitrospira sp.]
MLRTTGNSRHHGMPRSWHVMVFSVGGRRLAVKTLEVGDIGQWGESIPVPGRTPFVTAVIRRNQTVLPVFDLAAVLCRTIQGNSPLCLRVKHALGDMVICIDEKIPVLQTLDHSVIQAYRGTDVPAEGSYANGEEEIPILSVSRLGMGSW